eukprot:superscaffoldBa00003215_g16400
MVLNNTPKTTASTPLDKHMDSLEHPVLQSQGKGARRKGRFKGSDGSTSSDTTTNSLVRQQLNQCTSLQLYLFATAQQHCRGFGSPEDLPEPISGWGSPFSSSSPLRLFGGPRPCGPSVRTWTEAERMPLPDRESVRRPGPLHAVLWAGPSSESTASISKRRHDNRYQPGERMFFSCPEVSVTCRLVESLVLSSRESMLDSVRGGDLGSQVRRADDLRLSATCPPAVTPDPNQLCPRNRLWG